MIVNIPEGTKPRRRLASPYKELSERGITKNNWLEHLDEMEDSEITAMLNIDPPVNRECLDEERKARPSLTDRMRAEGMRDFG